MTPELELILTLARERSQKRLAEIKAKRQQAIDKVLIEYHGRDVSINHETFLWNSDKGFHEPYWSLQTPSGESISIRTKLEWFKGMAGRREKAQQIWCNL